MGGGGKRGNLIEKEYFWANCNYSGFVTFAEREASLIHLISSLLILDQVVYSYV